MGEENDLRKSMIFSDVVSMPAFQPSVIAEPIPGVKRLYQPQTGPTCTAQSGSTKATINTEKENN